MTQLSKTNAGGRQADLREQLCFHCFKTIFCYVWQADDLEKHGFKKIDPLLSFCSKHGEVKKDMSVVSAENTNEKALSEVRLLIWKVLTKCIAK